jgi:hypothetical protein
MGWDGPLSGGRSLSKENVAKETKQGNLLDPGLSLQNALLGFP